MGLILTGYPTAAVGPRRTATPAINDGKWRHSAALSEIRAVFLNGEQRSVNRKVQGSNPWSGANCKFETDPVAHEGPEPVHPLYIHCPYSVACGLRDRLVSDSGWSLDGKLGSSDADDDSDTARLSGVVEGRSRSNTALMLRNPHGVIGVSRHPVTLRGLARHAPTVNGNPSRAKPSNISRNRVVRPQNRP